MQLSGSESVEDVVQESQDFEEEIFLDAIRDFYEQEFERNKGLYDYVADHTNNFRDFSSEVIREEPNVVKLLRYLVKPPISQMKFGQFAGITSTDSYEKESPTTPQHDTAEQMADFVERNLDERKVPWLNEDVDEEYEVEQSREWVCDIIAQSEAKTRYRNWRKDVQEEKVAETMLKAGLEKVNISLLESEDDIPTGSFTPETKVSVTGGDHQKADFVARERDGGLVFIEAKAIGVKIDSYKRIKEIRNKESDWRRTHPDSTVAAALSGWIPESQIETLLNDDITVFWEHRLDTLESHFS
ncbi:XamI family restriction endonuclease [Halorubrum sp. JWXQ-INN 858]|uniref:XamI family restriction endonuclease n=1 Tax=Halorubrum sp. JWXQ-INN 858 TaxID=2690782 RepID=UPI0013571CF5|nr:XamI family restriction endonuclease [Halorubrum sp. JWXQ-INN 858]MWV65665.1 XamI family restriction endonuclease [Halorubrum sp. JWXQ-INN 858]